MKIHSICLVKNEIDIIAQSLKAATEWCDFIYVFDNGSTDGTWETVLDLSTDYEQIIPYKQDNCPYTNGLRGQVFNHFRGNSSSGDWWCRLDADEFYIDNPQIFLANVPQEYQLIWNASFQYYFTDKDLTLYNQNPFLYADDVAIGEKCRYYLNNWSERRFIKYHKNLIWGRNDGWPQNLGTSYPVRIRLKHFQYRSPQQIQKRLDIRREAIVRGCGSFRHEAQADWRTRVFDKSKPKRNVIDETNIPQSWEGRVVEASQLNYDAHDGKYATREDLMPPIKEQATKLVKIITKTKKLFKVIEKNMKQLWPDVAT